MSIVEKRRKIWSEIKDLVRKMPKLPALTPEERDKIREFLSKLYELFTQYVETLSEVERKERFCVGKICVSFEEIPEIIKRDMEVGVLSSELYQILINLFE